MANLQIKGIDDHLYAQLKALAASENRSISQQVLYLVRSYLAKRPQLQRTKTAAQVLLELSGSWQDSRPTEQIVAELKKARRNSKKLAKSF
ncbi:MAG: hypothetical protein ACYSR9_08790 [Planctomycetota bacterium]|jgi:plasmid stability protein